MKHIRFLSLLMALVLALSLLPVTAFAKEEMTDISPETEAASSIAEPSQDIAIVEEQSSLLVCSPAICDALNHSANISATTQSTGLTLEQLRQKFPNGKYWNHAGNPGSSNSVNNQDGYTSTPCSQHGVVGTSAQTCNGFAPSGTQLSWQCMGYAEKLGYDATGYNPRNNANGWYT